MVSSKGYFFKISTRSTLIGKGLLPWLMIICNLVWKEVCPSDAMLVMRLHSL